MRVDELHAHAYAGTERLEYQVTELAGQRDRPVDQPDPGALADHQARGKRRARFDVDFWHRHAGLYLEGLREDGGGYSCDIPVTLMGFERAVQDLDAVMDHLHTSPSVRTDRMLVGGASRGGILSIAYAGLRPDCFIGAINFNGGWLGRACPTHASVNSIIFERGAAFGRGTLWLHGSYDQYYRIAHCRSNFERYLAAGGRGSFVAARGGHILLGNPDLWIPPVNEYMHKIAAAANSPSC